MDDVLVVAVLQRLQDMFHTVACLFLIEVGLRNDSIEQLSTTKTLQNDVIAVRFLEEIQLPQLQTGRVRVRLGLFHI